MPQHFTAPPATIGLSDPLVNSLKVLTETARNSYSSAQSAREASKSATLTYNNDVMHMRAKAADLVRQIKSYAELQADPVPVFAAADIPAPQPPATQPAPSIPNNFTIGLELNGAITLRWKASNATPSSGTFFNVSRKIAGESAFTVIGTVGAKKFTDSTLPQGSASVTYQVTPVRGDVFYPPSAGVEVFFGVAGGGGGLMVKNATLVTPDGVMKMAA